MTKKTSLEASDSVVKRNTIFSKLKHEAKQFCLSTGLHGYRFIVLPRRMLLERVIWITICTISAITVLTLLCVAWITFQKSPTVLLTESNHFPIWNYPFPAVTVCNFNKVSKTTMLQFAKTLSEPNSNNHKIEKLAEDLRVIFQLIKITENVPRVNYTHIQQLLDINGIMIDSLFDKLSPSCEDVILRCLWKGEEKRCESLFERIKTTLGYCCSFNYFALRTHKFEGKLRVRTPNEPRRVTSCGQQTALEIMINNNVQDYFATFVPSTGQEIVLHNPYEFPDWNKQACMTSDKSVNLISLAPSITYSQEMQSVNLEQRQCLFPDERKLTYFKYYNFHNCMVECRMNLTEKLCKCVPFYYIQDNSVPVDNICNLRNIECLRTNDHLITSSIPNVILSKPDDIEQQNFDTENTWCKCLPDCETTEYVAESSGGVLNRQFSLNQDSLYGGVKLQNHSVVRVFFNDLSGIRNRRYFKFQWHTLLAYYGGLLGLFLGFSYITAIEVFYFFIIRPTVGNIKKQSQKSQMKNVQSTQNPKTLRSHELIRKRTRAKFTYLD